MLQTVIPSKARRKILALFFHNLNESFYLRKIVRDVDEEVNAVKRELDILSEGKILLKERRLNKIFYTLNRNYIFFEEFLRIFAKTTTLAEALYKNLSRIGKIKFISLSIKYIKRQAVKDDEVYLLFVGIMVVPEIVSVMADSEKEFGREINYTVMTDEEFTFRKRNNDPFLLKFLRSPKIMLVGSEEELLK